MDWKVILIPVLTTFLTTGALYFKESLQRKKTIKRSVLEEKLKDLYNELFSISLKYTDRLQQSFFVTQKEMFEIDGELFPKEDTEMIHGNEIWDKVIMKIRETIHKKLHLLDGEDLINWHQIELMEVEESFEPDKANIEKYKALKRFLVDISIKYKALHKEYHNT